MLPILRPSTLRALVILLAALAGLTALGGCQGRGGGRSESTPSELPDPTRSAPDGCGLPDPCGLTLGAAREAEVDLGRGASAYDGDERVATLAARWPQTVGDAFAALTVSAGLTFPPEVEPRVVLMPLDDERVPWRIDTEIAAGRRRPVVRVNLEPILGRLHTPETALGGALAEAVLMNHAPHQAPPPRWVVRLASLVGGGNAGALLNTLARRSAAGDGDATRVDPDDPRVADPTAVAALLLLGRPESGVQRFLHFVADGDDPDEMLARRIRDPMGRWAGSGRARLAARLGEIDTRGWTLLLEARRAREEAGRAALEAMLPESVPPGVRREIEALTAEAFLDEGDFASARQVLSTFDEVALAGLEDPGRAWRLRLRAEEGPGGDRARAAAQARRIRRDFPAAWRRGRPAPAAGEATSAAALDFRQVVATLTRLLAEHRTGAAKRVIDGLGEGARALELEPLIRAVARAEAHPSPEAIAVNRNRVGAWLTDPTEASATSVRDGGAAAGVALARALPPHDGTPGREDAVRLLAEAAGPGRAVRELSPIWQRAPSLMPGDLDALLGVARWGELKVWVEGHAPHTLAHVGGDRMWEHLRHGLDPSWLAGNDDVLRDLRDPGYARRRGAFQRVVNAGQVTPELVALALRDPAPLLRREATRVAGEEGFEALVRFAFEDEAWVVRQAACPAAVRALGPSASTHLRRALALDPAPQVRLAAAGSLLDVAGEREPGLVPLLVALLDGAEPQLAELLVRGLPRLPKGPVVCAVLGALEREVSRQSPRAPYLSRLFAVLQRATQRDPGYYPTMTPAEVRRLVAQLRQRLEPYVTGAPR